MTFDLAAQGAQRWPQRRAVWAEGRWYHYDELNLRAEQLAARLYSEGLRVGDRVAVLALNHLAHIDLLLAAAKLGVIYTPFNYRLSAAETAKLAGYVHPAFLFFDAHCAATSRVFSCPRVALADYESWRTAATVVRPTHHAQAEDIHMLLFTGGSTGTPKAACIPYRQIAANNAATVHGWGLQADDCAIQATPCFHAALNVYTTPLLSIGARLVLMPQFDAAHYLELLSAHQATRLFMVPTMFQMLAESPAFANTPFTAIRSTVSGGAPCTPALRARFAEKGLAFAQGYGMTEAGVNCFVPDVAAADSIGRPMPGLVAVVRRADGSSCQPNEVGELTLSGAQICAGYFERAGEWAECFRDHWLWTGDLAWVDTDGRFRIAGRRKEMFISGGENVYPSEAEAVLSSHPAIAECAVLGVPHPQWGEVGLASISLKTGAALDAESLSQWLRPLLAGYKRPREFFFLPVLPKTGAGKTDKPAIRRAYEAHREEIV